MKKNILFVIPGLDSGGAEKSFVNLLSTIDFNKFNVDLYLLSELKGFNYNSLPPEVNHLELQNNHKIFTLSLLNSISDYLKIKKYNLVYHRIIFTLINRLIKNNTISEQRTWKHVRCSIDALPKKYDMAIGYLEKSSIYFVVDKVKAKKKIGWIHTNYDNSDMNKKIDYPFFNKLDNLVTVSEECAASLKKNFTELEPKIKIIYNILSPNQLFKLSQKNTSISPFSKKQIKILTVARLSSEKGIDIAINACNIVASKGYNFVWIVLGEGIEREKLQKTVNKYGLNKHFYLLGNKDNPYPYFRFADIYVQPSRFEGKSIAIDEAKILKKPIIVTEFSTARDQITNGIDGIIVDMDAKSVAAGIEELIRNKELRNRLIKTLSKNDMGTEGEIEKFYKLI